MAKEEEVKNNSVKDLIKDLSKKYKNNNLILKANVVPTFKRLPTRAFNLGFVQYGGFPKGTIIEISGPEHSGKTLMATLTLADAQRENPTKSVAYIDAEFLLDVDFHQKMNGLDLDRLYYVRPTMMSGEQILDMAIELLKCDDICAVAIDSVPALKPQIVWESDLTEDKGMRATMAKKLHMSLPMIKSIVAEKESNFIVINQTRDKQVQVGAKTITVPEEACGSACKFYSDIIMRCGKRTFTNGDDMEYKAQGKDEGQGADGVRIKFKCIKNKTAKVDRGGGFITYRYATGIDYVNDMIETACLFDYLPKAGNYYTLVNPATAVPYKDENGKDLRDYKKNLIAYLQNHQDFALEYLSALTKEISGSDKSYGMLIDTSDIDREQALLDANEIEE